MPEYLSPGVYVEEFESGGRPMEGVGTSTAGFVGIAAKGPVGGVPQLVTNIADFRRKYGDNLSENEFGDYRFLSYAVEHFFTNGGTRAYIARVAPPDAKKAESAGGGPIRFRAANAGAWGNELSVVITPAAKAKTQIKKLISPRQIEVKNGAGFHAGDVIVLTDGDEKKYNRVVKAQDKILDLLEDYDESVVDVALAPQKILTTCEFNMDVFHDDVAENYSDLSFNINIPNYILKKLEKSLLIAVELGETPEDATPPFALISGGEPAREVTFAFDDGTNGSMAAVTPDVFIGVDKGPGRRTGIQAFLDNSIVSIMAVPGVTDPNVQISLVDHCENLKSRFAVLDIPRNVRATDEILTCREMFDSTYSAMYHPWLTVYDPLDKRNIAIPPSGSVIGIYARTDNERGVHKAPANEVVRGCLGLDISYGKGEQDILNPRGVNLIRSLPGQGIRVWGARTVSSNSLWKYINVRRLFIFVEESIKANTNWVVFEPNDETLWSRVQRTIEVFLNGLWRGGALAGTTPAEAFYVMVGRSTMSQDDIDNGRLICEIGIAPVKPAEFVIFRITQRTASE